MSLRLARTAALIVAAGALCLGAAGCAPEPAGPASPGSTASSGTASPRATAPSPTASPTGAGIAVPASCEQLYSAGMLSTLRSAQTLNDPGITMYATQIVPALEILESGIPTLRCTWGTPGGAGLATQVSIVDATQAGAVQRALSGSGLSCQSLGEGTICRGETRTVDFNDKVVTRGETHYLRGNGWVATSWIDYQPDGYTEDIAATLWR